MKIFSKYISENYNHVVYEILGIRLKFKNPYRDIYRRVEGVNQLLDYIVDVDNLPPAKGELRSKQLQVVEILKVVDGICKKHSINYWLDFGSLLGAARHKGFIPWDDDIDICLIRDEYEKLLAILHKELTNTQYYARERLKYGNNFQIRVRLKEVNVGIDIFPVDKYPDTQKKETTDEEICKKFNRARIHLDKKWNKKEYTDEQIQLAKIDIKKFMEEEGLTNKKINIAEPLLFYGIDYYHKWQYKSFEYKTIFPLKELEFEGLYFPVPNKYEKHLNGIYGNWHQLPKRFDNIDSFWNQEVEDETV